MQKLNYVNWPTFDLFPVPYAYAAISIRNIAAAPIIHPKNRTKLLPDLFAVLEGRIL